MIVIPKHHLIGDKKRSYTFLPQSNDTVVVSRFAADHCEYRKELEVQRARRLWTYLLKLGYERF